jgi:CRP-like cAMP-binding protein
MRDELGLLGDLRDVGEIATIPKGVTIVHAGERARHVAILLEGVVEEVLGATVTVVDRPGTLLAPECALTGEPAIGTLRAVTRSALLLIAPDELWALMDAAVHAWILAHLEDRVARAREVLGVGAA